MTTAPVAPAGPAARSGWLWTLLAPVRWYVRRFPIHRGKGLLLRHVLLPSLPAPPAEFETVLAGGARIRLQYRETIGWSTLLYGPFEDAELRCVAALVRPGDTVFDVGANIGLFTVVLARAAGADGRVIAAEPVPANAARAQANLALNGLANARIVGAAVGAAAGSVRLNLADDAAYPSIGAVAEARGTGRSIDVPLRRLDDLWREAGSPPVRFVKIDVEGAELDVLRGAADLLRLAAPTLLLEANDAAALARLRAELEPLGYELRQPAGFTVHNYLAVPRAGPER